MTWDGYTDRSLPPKWWSRLEDWFFRSWPFLVILLYVLIFFVSPFFAEPEPSVDALILEELERRSGPIN